MDRNYFVRPKSLKVGFVAPLAGSVDRNTKMKVSPVSYSESLPSRGAWIEMGSNCAAAKRPRSLPSRGAWIEIKSRDYIPAAEWVAPLAGSVDRNVPRHGLLLPDGRVAPLAGSVDRNLKRVRKAERDTASLPSRGAWIEMAKMTAGKMRNKVAPLAGSVDRNNRSRLTGELSTTGRSPRGERG